MNPTEVFKALDRAAEAIASAEANAFALAGGIASGTVPVSAMTQAELDECYHVFGRRRRREPALQYAAARVEVWEAAMAAVRAEAERR